jgi:hypothetical protein
LDTDASTVRLIGGESVLELSLLQVEKINATSINKKDGGLIRYFIIFSDKP